jgi:hypothetical protein
MNNDEMMKQLEKELNLSEPGRGCRGRDRMP